MAEAETTVGGAIDRAFVEEFAQRWHEAWNSQDVAKVLACMETDIVYDDDAWPTTMRGSSSNIRGVPFPTCASRWSTGLTSIRTRPRWPGTGVALRHIPGGSTRRA